MSHKWNIDDKVFIVKQVDTDVWVATGTVDAVHRGGIMVGVNKYSDEFIYPTKEQAIEKAKEILEENYTSSLEELNQQYQYSLNSLK